jgi:biopolymer transport protein ExbD
VRLVERTGVAADVPTASMADVAFLLIIYFMLISTLAIHRGLDLGLPRPDEEAASARPAIWIDVREDGTLLLDSRPLPLAALLPALAPLLARDPDRLVVLRPAPEAAYGDVVAVLDELRRGAARGVPVRRLALPTRRELAAHAHAFADSGPDDEGTGMVGPSNNAVGYAPTAGSAAPAAGPPHE